MSRPEDDLVAWRTKLKISQGEAGAMLRPPVKQQTWGYWEAGEQPSLHNAFEIERITEGEIKASRFARPHLAQRRRAKRTARRTGTDG